MQIGEGCAIAKGLDLSRRSRRRTVAALRVSAVLAALALLVRALPFAAALPAQCDAALAAHYAAALAALQDENAALRQQLTAQGYAAALPTVPEGTAPALLLERRPDALVLACAGAGEGQEVLDAAARYVGRVSAVTRDTATVALVGTQGCAIPGLVEGAAGLCRRGGGTLYLTGLPVGAGLAAGQSVYTVTGCLLGRLGADPAPDAAGLTAAVPLTAIGEIRGNRYLLKTPG